MSLIDYIPLYEPLERVRYVGEGKAGIIYQLDNYSCVKIPKEIDEKSYRKVQKEAEIADELYRGGVSVPKPVGLFRFPVSFGASSSSLKTEAFILGFVQEFIDGLLYENLPQDLLEAAKRKYLQESDKARALGFIGYDSCYSGGNALYQVKNNLLERAVLIDFGAWVRRV